MASSTTEIANLALLHLGQSVSIADLDTENSSAARVLRRLYELCRDEVLLEIPWPFATRIEELSLVEEDPTDEWAYSYRYPVDCMKDGGFRRILSGARVDDGSSAVRYVIVGDDAGRLVYTDMEDASAEITVKEENVSRYSPKFVAALAYLMAGRGAPAITNGDPHQLGVRALQLYALEVSTAKAKASNEQRKDPEPLNEFLAGR